MSPRLVCDARKHGMRVTKDTHKHAQKYVNILSQSIYTLHLVTIAVQLKERAPGHIETYTYTKCFVPFKTYTYTKYFVPF